MKLLFEASMDKARANKPAFLVYRLYCRISEKAYVGMTVQKLNLRWSCHVSAAKLLRRKSHLQYAIRAFGRNSFDVEAIEYCNSKSHMERRERYWIKKLNTIYPYGYNKSRGGVSNLGWHHTEDAKRLMALKAMGRRPSAETRERLSAWQRGKKLSQEHRDKIGRAGLGRKHSPESLAKMSAIQSQRTWYPRQPWRTA